MKKKILENIQLFIEENKLDEAMRLIDECFKINLEDIEMYSMKAIVLIMQAKTNEAEKALKEGLSIDAENFDLNFNLAYLYEQMEMYLKALEIYENIVFNMKDCEQRQQIIEYLNKFEDKYKDAIQKQLEESYEPVGEITSNGKNKYLHLMYDSPYCERIISLINDNFCGDEHKFVFIGKRNLNLKYINIKNIYNAEILDLQYDIDKLMGHIENCSRIIIQYLFDVYCEIVCRFKVNKPIYWFLWGGDLYNYIDFNMYSSLTQKFLETIGLDNISTINKNSLNYIFRKSAIRKVNKIGINFKQDFKILKKNFITKSECVDYVFPNPVEYKNLDTSYEENKYEELKRNYKNVILIGNSANPSNNHVDILYKLKKMQNQSFCIIMPLSYGGNEEYINQIISLGNELFKDRFIPLLEYINSIEYRKLLSIVDSAIMAHNRPQAAGNINALIYLGKKVFMEKQSSFYFYLKEIGIEVYDVSDINKFDDLFKIDKKIQETNKIKILQTFGNKAAVEALSRFFK